jgi:histidyl-tRNA synthetase
VIRAIKGTRDILPPESELFQLAERHVHDVFRLYNYHEIRTPIIEPTELFARSVGEETDIVSKEMYTFADRDETSITLRPEATASVVRAYLEQRLWERPRLARLYYVGPMFRRERPQKGRYRQFSQIGAEALGSTEPQVDYELIEMLVALLDRCGIEGWELLLNSVGCPDDRPRYHEALRKALEPELPRMCTDCRRRAHTNPLRVLDCKVPEDQPVIARLPSILDFLDEKCRRHFEAVQRMLDAGRIRYRVNPRLVRGLDYYTSTAFEFVHGSLGSQNALLGGGRYDGLAQALGGPAGVGAGIGFAIGEDRFVMAMAAARGGHTSEQTGGTVDAFLIPIGEEALLPALLLARELRAKDLVIEVGEVRRKVGKLLETADRVGARFAVMLGEQELSSGQFAVKDLRAKEQQTVAREDLPQYLARQSGRQLKAETGS